MRIIAAALSWFAVLGLSAGRAGEPGLIAWWKLNAGIYEEDSSGGGHDGILVGSPSWIAGQPGNADGAINLSGSGQCVNIANTADFTDNPADLSVSLWFKTSHDFSSGNVVLVGKTDDQIYADNTGWEIGIETSNNLWAGLQYAGGRIWKGRCAQGVNDGAWHHAVMSISWGTNVVLYLDGVNTPYDCSSGEFVPGNTHNTNNIIIGGDVFGDYYTGALDDIRIYSTALQQNDVTTLYNAGADKPQDLTSNLVGYWPMNESSGTNVPDVSGNGHDGTALHDPAWSAGRSHNCLTFSGPLNQGLQTSAVVNSGPMTVAGWFKMTSDYASATEPMVLFLCGDSLGSHSDWGLSFNNDLESVHTTGSLYFSTWNDDATPRVVEVATPQTSWTGGVWYHAAGVDDGTNLLIYVNGSLAVSAAVSHARGVPGAQYSTFAYSPFDIGGHGACWASCSLEEWRMYSRALTSTEVLVLAGSVGGSVVSPIPLTAERQGDAIILSWANPSFALQAAPTPTGAFTNIPAATSPYTNSLAGPAMFFRLEY